MRPLLRAIGLIMVVLWAGCLVQPEKQDTVYQQYNGSRFSIDYPADWKVNEGGEVVSFSSAQEGSGDAFLEGLSVAAFAGPETFDQLEAKERAILYEGETVTRVERKPLNGKDALFMETEGQSAPGSRIQVYRKTVYARQGEQVYRVGYAIEKAAGKQEKFGPVFEKMLGSLLLKAPASVAPAGVLYQNPEFSIRYPAGWGVDDEWIILSSPEEKSGEPARNLVSARTWASDETLEDLLAYESGVLGVAANITRAQAGEFNDQEAVRLEGEYPATENQEAAPFAIIYFKEGRQVYRLKYTLEESQADRWMPDVSHMFQSFTTMTPIQAADGYRWYAGKKYSIEYPKTWQRSTEDWYRFVSRKESAGDRVVEDFIVQIWTGSETLDDLEASEKSLLYGNDTLTRVQRLQFRGHDAVLMEYIGALYPGSVERQNFKVIQFKAGDRIYRLASTFENATGKKEKFEPVFDALFDSFEPKSPVAALDYTYYSSPLFLLYYPRGWSVDDQESGTFAFSSPLEDANDDIWDEFLVQVWAGNQTTAKEFEEMEKTTHDNRIRVTRSEPALFQDYPAYVIEMEGPVQDGIQPMLYKTVYFRNGRWVYRLHYALEEDKRGWYEPVMEDMLGRIKIGA